MHGGNGKAHCRRHTFEMIRQRFRCVVRLLRKNAFFHLGVQRLAQMLLNITTAGRENQIICAPSVDAFTATNLSKFSATSTRIASDRESKEARRCAIPEERSWYVALGCTTERKALGLKDLEVMSTAASGQHR